MGIQVHEVIFETGVPIPARTHFGHAVNPNSKMGIIRRLANSPIGTSVLFPPDTAGISATCCAFGRKWATMRNMPDGVRVWKIGEPADLRGTKRSYKRVVAHGAKAKANGFGGRVEFAPRPAA